MSQSPDGRYAASLRCICRAPLRALEVIRAHRYLDDDFYVVTRNYTFDIDTTALLDPLASAYCWSAPASPCSGRQAWAVAAAIALAGLSALSGTSSSSPSTPSGQSS